MSQEGRGRPGRSGSWSAEQENPLLETRLSPGRRRCAATGSETDMGCARPSLFLLRKPRPRLSPALRPMGASSWPPVSFAGPPLRGASLGALGAPPRHLPRARETPIPRSAPRERCPRQAGASLPGGPGGNRTISATLLSTSRRLAFLQLLEKPVLGRGCISARRTRTWSWVAASMFLCSVQKGHLAGGGSR